MTVAPDQFMIDRALQAAARSPCRSKRGVVLYDMATGAFRGEGCNGPPALLPCPGRDRCAGNCGQRSVHAEVRALRAALAYIHSGHPPGPYDLIHVELALPAEPPPAWMWGRSDSAELLRKWSAENSAVVACGGPSCPSCAAQIRDVTFVGGVWLYEKRRCTCGYGNRFGPHTQDCRIRPLNKRGEWDPGPHWIRYTTEEFYEATLRSCGMKP